mmetsp:Transcript_58793/g.127184  ORF Transcript_58793/g.127184 Transcript_58793/m.127184 type:complete len:714 (-) Transcript_58793:94-2235(-)
MGQAASSGNIEEKYFLQKVKLGQGSFGTVWRAVERESGKTVAVKQLDKASLPRRGVRREDIEREISMMRACRHENLTQLYDSFEDDKNIYLALEYCDGGDFGDKVKERGMGLTEPEVAEWVRQMCAAIAALHVLNICHRDIKPDNFMVSEGQTLKLSDFGLAIFLPKGKLLNEKCGTPAFMAPEQHNLPSRSRGYGFPADVWATGVSMYMVMFGSRHPFMTDRGQLDDKLLLQGTLDFRENSGARFLGFDIGRGALRFSDAARELCSRMVEPDVARRITAEDAIRQPWINSGRAGGGSSPSPPPPAWPKAQANTSASGTPDRPFPHAAPSPTVLKLKDENSVLKAQLEERQLREQQLLEGIHRQDQLRRQHEQDHLQRQAEMREKMQREERERQMELYRQAEAREEARRVPQKLHEIQRPSNREGSRRLQSEMVPVGALPIGTRCRYSSSQYGWMPCVVEGINETDGTYDLDVRQHASPSNIAPAKPIASASEVWPAGTWAQYHSSTANVTLPAVVVSFNDDDGTYNLDVRERADLDRIRARFDKDKGDSGLLMGEERSQRPPVMPYATNRDGSEARPLRIADLESSAAVSGASGAQPNPAEREDIASFSLPEGARCVVLDVGPAVLDAVPGDGRCSVSLLPPAGPRKMTVDMERIRAPDDPVYAWPPGTRVEYESSTMGTWIKAVVVGFNAREGRYNLDVRENAVSQRVRPR